MKISLPVWFCILGICLLTHNGNVLAQQQLTRQWTAFHNGSLTGLDHSNAILCDSNGNVFVTGQSFQNSPSGSITTVKYDSSGNTMWTDNYKGVIVTAQNEGTDICLDPFGNVLVTGNVALNDGDFAIVKFNQSGRLWAKNKEPYWFGSGVDFAKEIATDNAGNIYCVASIQSLSGQMQDLYTLKCDSAGNDIWGVDYSSASGDDWAEGLAVTPNGHCFSITSSFNFFGSATYDMQTLHYDSSGTQQWISSYNCSSAQSDDYPMDITCDASYNTWLCGAADAGVNTDFAAMKQNLYGTRIWTVTYNGTANGNDSAIAISYLSKNLAVVTGRTREIVNGFTLDAITTMLIDSGTVLWTSFYYGDSLNAVPTAMTTDAFGNVYVSGYYQTAAQGFNGVLLVYDSVGALIFVDQYDGTANLNDRFNDLVVDHLNYIYVTGQSYSASNNSDYITIKYAMQGISSIQESNGINGFLMYPNPSTGEFHIKGYNNPGTILKIYNVDGKAVFTETIESARMDLSLKSKGMGPGIYFVQLSNSNNAVTKKLIIQ